MIIQVCFLDRVHAATFFGSEWVFNSILRLNLLRESWLKLETGGNNFNASSPELSTLAAPQSYGLYNPNEAAKRNSRHPAKHKYHEER